MNLPSPGGIPVDKAAGDPVSAATIKSVRLYPLRGIESRRGYHTLPDHKNGQRCGGNKSAIAKIADKVSGVFVPAVITIAIISTIGWLLAGETMAFALAEESPFSSSAVRVL